MPLTLTSPAFVASGEIPRKYTCDGDNVSPPLRWSGVAAGARSLALIVDDPDAPDPAAPKRVWVHWVIYDLPASDGSLSEGAVNARPREGKNDFGNTGWGGPCPFVGRHRYFFRLYALDTRLGDLNDPTRKQLDAAMKGHIIEVAELMGTYERVR